MVFNLLHKRLLLLLFTHHPHLDRGRGGADQPHLVRRVYLNIIPSQGASLQTQERGNQRLAKNFIATLLVKLSSMIWFSVAVKLYSDYSSRAFGAGASALRTTHCPRAVAMAQYFLDFVYTLTNCMSCFPGSPQLKINNRSFKILRLLGEVNIGAKNKILARC